MKKKKMLIGLLVASATLVALSSCGGNKKPKKSSSEVISSQVESSNEISSAETSSSEVESSSDESIIESSTNAENSSTTIEEQSSVEESQASLSSIESEESSESSSEAPKKCNITFVDGDNETSKEYTFGDKMGAITSPTKETLTNDLYIVTYQFDGWYDENKVLYTADTVINDDVTLYSSFSVKTIKLNKTELADYVDVTNLINENNLLDVISLKDYDIVTFYDGSNDISKYNVATFQIGDVCKCINVNSNTPFHILCGNGNLESSFFFLPYVISFNVENDVDYNIYYNGKDFVYNDKYYEIQYDLNGYLTSFNNYPAIYNTTYTAKPNLSALASVTKDALMYEMYELGNENNSCTLTLEGKNWVCSSNDKKMVFLSGILPLTLKEIDKYLYDMNSGFALESAYKDGNHYILNYVFKTAKITLTFDQFGFVRQIDMIDFIVGEEETYICYPKDYKVTKFNVKTFTNYIFNAKTELPGYIHADIKGYGESFEVDYLIRDGQLLFEKTAPALYAAEICDPYYKINNVRSLLNRDNLEMYFDCEKDQFVATYSDGKYTVTMVFDSYGNIVSLRNNNPSIDMTINFTYEYGDYYLVNLYGSTEETAYVSKDSIKTLVPTRDPIQIDEERYIVFEFAGFYLDSEFKYEFNPEKDKFEDEMKLYCKFIDSAQYIVTWHTNPLDSSVVTYTFVQKGENVKELKASKLDWYEFDGWYIDPEFKERANFEKMNGNLEYFAHYIPKTYENFAILGQGSFESGINTFETINNNEFDRFGCFNIKGNILFENEKGKFHTTVDENTYFVFDVEEGCLLTYASKSSNNKSTTVLFMEDDSVYQSGLTNRNFFFKDGELVRCANGDKAFEGITYYYLVKEANAEINKVSELSIQLKPGRYLLLNVSNTELLEFSFQYKS